MPGCPRPVDSRLRGNDGVGMLGMTAALPFTSGLRIKSAMTVCRARPSPPCGYCLEASMTAGRLCWLVVTPPCGYCLEASMTGRAVGVVVLVVWLRYLLVMFVI